MIRERKPENCISGEMCLKYNKREDLNCEDCDHFVSDTAIDDALETMRQKGEK